MKWLKENWLWVLLNGGAVIVVASWFWPLTVRQPNQLLIYSGQWAVRFLLISLAMTPLNTLLGWRAALKLRKPAGLWAFAFGAMHFMANLVETWADWWHTPIPDYIAALGVMALSVLTMMAATSTRWAMKRLGKWWKRLHRLVYAAAPVALAHAMLEANNKRVLIYEAQVDLEMGVYLIVLVILLAARLPMVRTALAHRRSQTSAKPSYTPIKRLD